MTPATESDYCEKFTRSLNLLFLEAWKTCQSKPVQGLFLLQTYYRQKRKASIRKEAEKLGIVTPPVQIFSMTKQFNLHCKGCYSMAGETCSDELSISRIATLFREASELGVGVILLAGGEPLMRPEVLWEAGKQKDIIFPVFTNGILLNKGSIRYFRQNKNLIPILNAECGRYRTDTRLLQCMEQLQKSHQMYGLSFTLTNQTFEETTHPVWLNTHRNLGCSLFFLVKYIPQNESEMRLCLTREQKTSLPGRLEKLRRKIPALFCLSILNPEFLPLPFHRIQRFR